MEKIDMREYVIRLREMVDRSLKLWKPTTHIENGDVVHLAWQFEQTHVIVDIFWLDGDEGVNLQILHPRRRHHFEWHGLTEKTLDGLIDRIGNITQTIMYRSPHER